MQMNKILVNLMLSLVPSQDRRHQLRDRWLGSRQIPPKMTPDVLLMHKTYGPIYAPLYNPRVEIASEGPEIYSKNGRRLETFFQRDRHSAHCPYIASPEYFVFDRFNIGLKTHFYAHNAMLETMGNPDRRYGYLIESEAIVPWDYKIFDRHQGLYKDFDAIFTYSYEILNEIPNAKFVPFAATPWYRGPGGVPDPEAYAKKTRNVSFMSSAKNMCDLHRYRIELAKLCKREVLADTYGCFDGGEYARIDEPYETYRYTIIVENDIRPYYFSERLTGSFIGMTVPIYVGAGRIGEFFNTDGMILMKPGDDIHKVLAQCSEKDYEQRLPAIRDNFQRALKYMNIWNSCYEKYILNDEVK